MYFYVKTQNYLDTIWKKKKAKTIMHDKIMPILNETKWILYFHFGGLLVHYSGSHLDYFNIFYKKKK